MATRKKRTTKKKSVRKKATKKKTVRKSRSARPGLTLGEYRKLPESKRRKLRLAKILRETDIESDLSIGIEDTIEEWMRLHRNYPEWALREIVNNVLLMQAKDATNKAKYKMFYRHPSFYYPNQF